MADLLTLNTLTVARSGTVLAASVTRALGAGALLLLTGPNGSGKTSLLRAMAGLLTPESGTVTAAPSHFITALPLAPSLETPRQYLGYQAALVQEQFSMIADIFGITPFLDTPLNRLSTGWRQRVKLTRLMLTDRRLWLLDEPSDGLDAAGVAALQALVATHLSNGGACVIATHDAQYWPNTDTVAFEGKVFA